MKKALIILISLLIAITAKSTTSFAELQVAVYTPLYEPQRYNPAFTGYTNIFCTPPLLSVWLSFVYPCLAEVELWMENRGSRSNVGPVLRTDRYIKGVDAHGIYGKVKLRAQHGGPGVAVTTTPYCEVPAAEQAETEIYVDGQSPTCPGFKFINTKTKPPAADGYVQSPAVAHFDNVTDDVPWDKFQYRVIIDHGDPQISFNNNFQITLSEGRHGYMANVTDGCNRSCTFNTGDVVVDNTPPTISINKPLENQIFTSTASIDVEIFFGDTLSPIRSVDLYVDRISGAPYAKFRGPWLIGLGNKDSVAINIREGGSHKLYLAVEDMAGNKTQISRVIQVQVPPSLIQPLDKMQIPIKK